MTVIYQDDSVENKFIISFLVIFILGFTIFITTYAFVVDIQENPFLTCISEPCKINIYTGVRTCTQGERITYDPTTEVCTQIGQCPNSFPCVDNGSWIDCSKNICPSTNIDCNCYNFGQCPKNISMAWKKEKEIYYSFSTGNVNNKKYGIPIFPYQDYKNNITSCRLRVEQEIFINFPICTAGNYFKDESNGFICCTYNNSCEYQI